MCIRKVTMLVAIISLFYLSTALAGDTYNFLSSGYCSSTTFDNDYSKEGCQVFFSYFITSKFTRNNSKSSCYGHCGAKYHRVGEMNMNSDVINCRNGCDNSFAQTGQAGSVYNSIIANTNFCGSKSDTSWQKGCQEYARLRWVIGNNVAAAAGNCDYSCFQWFGESNAKKSTCQSGCSAMSGWYN